MDADNSEWEFQKYGRWSTQQGSMEAFTALLCHRQKKHDHCVCTEETHEQLT
jgi:hypothetical protein